MEGVLRAFAELLIDDPSDLEGFGAAINRLLADEALAAAMKGSDEAYHPARTSDRRTSDRAVQAPYAASRSNWRWSPSRSAGRSGQVSGSAITVTVIVPA